MGQREPRQECPAFLAFLRTKPCCSCYAPAPSEAAHIRMGSPEHGKRSTGMQEKPHDRWALPLCAKCHRIGPRSQHGVGDERTYWLAQALDPFQIASDLWKAFAAEGGNIHPPRKKGRKPKREKTTRKILKNSRTSIPAAKLMSPKRKWPSGQKIPNRPFNRSKP